MADNARWFIVQTQTGYEDKVATNIIATAENLQLRDQILEVNIPTREEVTIVDKTIKLNKKGEKTGQVKFKLSPSDPMRYSFTRKDVNEKGQNVVVLTNDEGEESLFPIKRTVVEESGNEAVTFSFNKMTRIKVFPNYVFVKVNCVYKKCGDDEEEELSISNESWYVIRNVRGVTRFTSSDQKKPEWISPQEVKDCIYKYQKDRVVIAPYNSGDKVRIINGVYYGYDGTVKSVDTKEEKVYVLVSMLGTAAEVELDFNDVEAIEED